MKAFKVFAILLLITLLSSFAYADLKTDTQLYYSYDNNNISGSNPLDLTGIIGTGTTTGATTGATGIISQAFIYDGDGDYVETPSFQDAVTNTYCTWFNSDSITNVRNVIMSKRPSSGDRDWQLQVRGSPAKVGIFYYNGASSHAGSVESSTTILDDTDYFTCITRDGNDIELFVNAVSEGTDSTGSKGREDKVLQIGIYDGASGGNNGFNGWIDETSYFDKVLTQSEIEELYNIGLGLQYPYVTTANNFTITAIDNFYNTSITTFNATINGTFYNTTDGSIITPYLLNETNILNRTVQAENYENYANTTYNTSNGNLEAPLEPSLFTIEIQLFDILNSSKEILNFTIENKGVNFTTTNGTAYPEFETSTENITIYSNGYFTKQLVNQFVGFNFNETLLAESYINSSLFYINDSLRNTRITKYTANITSVDDTYTFMNLSISADNYFTTTFTDRNITGDKNFTINPDDSFYFTARDLNDLSIINQDIIINLQQGVNEQELNVSNGQGIIENITANLIYTLVVSTDGYETESFTYEHNGTTNPLENLTVYLINSSQVGFQDTQFNIVDISNLPVEEVLITARAFVNGTYQTVASGETDITGRKTFFLDSNKRHQITLSKTGFTNQEFFIDSPLDTEYTFRIDADGQYQGNDALKNIIYDINPQPAGLQNTTYQFNFSVTALDNDLEYFNVNVLVRNATTGATTNLGFNSSTDSSGGLLTVNPDFSSHYQKIAILKYCLKKQDFAEVCFYANYVVEKDYADERNFGALKQYINENLTDGERIFFFSMFLLITIIILVAIPFTRNLFAVLPAGGAALFYGWLFLPTASFIIVGVMTFIAFIYLLSRAS